MTLDDILVEIKNAESIVIMAHEAPDGDAIGSTLGLCLALRDMGKNPVVLMKDFPENFSYLPGREFIKEEATQEVYDMAFVFNDPNKTVDYKNVTVTVKGIIDEETAAAVRQEIAELTGKQENSEERVADEDESEGSDDTSDDTEGTEEV